jgi:hypothetical protein
VHLNPVRARWVEYAAAWRWSSFPGYSHRGRRLEWVASDEFLASWAGEFGGTDAAGAYRRSVSAGLAEPPASPWRAAYQGWVLGSGPFVDRVRARDLTATVDLRFYLRDKTVRRLNRHRPPERRLHFRSKFRWARDILESLKPWRWSGMWSRCIWPGPTWNSGSLVSVRPGSGALAM